MTLDIIVSAVDRFQVLIAGGLAIVAAGIAYRGARRQAHAILEAEEQRLVSHRRTVAAAFYAELAGIGARLNADLLLLTSDRQGAESGLDPIDISVFSADPSAVGALPADEAFVVANVYKLIIDLNRAYARMNDAAWAPEDEPLAMATRVELILKGLRLTLGRIREAAGLSEDKSADALAAWNEEDGNKGGSG